MNGTRWPLIALGCLAVGVVGATFFEQPDPRCQVPDARREVVFWHFWGGDDRRVVEEVVDRFNRSQEKHFVRAVAMPGNNLDVKLFLAVTGGDPPDLINQDDAIVADWAHRGALMPIDELTSPEEAKQLRQWLFPAARRLAEYDGRLYALPNGLDIRALYYNKTMLDQHGLEPPRTLAELDAIAETISPADFKGRRETFGFLPDPRRLWAWGVVFGGDFFDEEKCRVTADSEPIVGALDWMASYRRRYGTDEVAAFRQGDQSLPGKSFPLLAGRYAVLMDGQWRVRDIAASQQARRDAGLPPIQYGVCPLPPPPGGRENAGWVNGNFFLVPRGANNADGAWEFMKFWSGFGGHASDAATTCVAGGWIPVSQEVVDQPAFEQYLHDHPLFRTFVELAASQNQFPIPLIPGAPLFDREIKSVGAKAMYDGDAEPQQLLQQATERIQTNLDRIKSSSSPMP
jgi:multiple sugar transport system substrate-binding protein